MSTDLSETKRKISMFENSEKEKAEKEAKDRKKALFARKLSKFGESVDENPAYNNNNNNNEVLAKVKMFAEAPGSFINFLKIVRRNAPKASPGGGVK